MNKMDENKEIKLSDLLAKMKPGDVHKHEEVDWGPPVGKEKEGWGEDVWYNEDNKRHV
jgi:hypothetical protein